MDVKQIKDTYKVGLKVRLIELKDDCTKLNVGENGAIVLVDDVGTIHVKWDNGITLGLIYGEDKFSLE